MEENLVHLQVDVISTARPEPDPEPYTYRCAAEIRIVEGDRRMVCPARLLIRHPSGWMGVAAGFTFAMDPEVHPTFESRAEQARIWALDRFPCNEILSVFLLGTGAVAYPR